MDDGSNERAALMCQLEIGNIALRKVSKMLGLARHFLGDE